MIITNGINGTHSTKRHITAGIYAPIPTFFHSDEDESIDIPSVQKQVVYLARAGIAPLLCGSMGEAHHLLRSERTQLIHATRSALNDAGLKSTPIIAGTGAGSLKETLMLMKDAADAGADAVIVITSGYFAGAIANDKKALYDFFHTIADKSPIPVFIYNYPGASGGIDLDSDIITSLAKHPNIIGCKLTCGNVGKLTRIASVVSSSSFISSYPRSKPDTADRFLVLGGFTDFVTPSIFADAHGAITGLGNVAPYACARLFTLSEKLKAKAGTSKSSLTPSDGVSDADLLHTTLSLQGIVAQADRVLAVGGINGTKYVLHKIHGYGGPPRRPLPPIDAKKGDELYNNEWVKALLEEEARAKKLKSQ